MLFTTGSDGPPILKSQVGDTINRVHIEAHWDEVLGVATSIRAGTVTASALLARKLGAHFSTVALVFAAALAPLDDLLAAHPST